MCLISIINLPFPTNMKIPDLLSQAMMFHCRIYEMVTAEPFENYGLRATEIICDYVDYFHFLVQYLSLLQGFG